MAVYFIQAGDAGPVKIGMAVSPANRLRDLQIAHYEDLTLRRLFEGHAAEEALLHVHFAHLHIRGEWYRPDPAILTGPVPLAEMPLDDAAFRAAASIGLQSVLALRDRKVRRGELLAGLLAGEDHKVVAARAGKSLANIHDDRHTARRMLAKRASEGAAA